jgi:hypothetical protein
VARDPVALGVAPLRVVLVMQVERVLGRG